MRKPSFAEFAESVDTKPSGPVPVEGEAGIRKGKLLKRPEKSDWESNSWFPDRLPSARSGWRVNDDSISTNVYFVLMDGVWVQFYCQC